MCHFVYVLITECGPEDKPSDPCMATFSSPDGITGSRLFCTYLEDIWQKQRRIPLPVVWPLHNHCDGNAEHVRKIVAIFN